MSKPLKPKEPLIAVMLTFILAGLGQVYVGRPIRGLILLGIQVFTLLFICYYLYLPDTFLTVSLILLILGMFFYALFIIYDAYRLAKKYNAEQNLERSISMLKRIGLILAILFFMFNPFISTFVEVFIQQNYFHTFQIVSSSMDPTFKKQDMILAKTGTYKREIPRRGDVIAFRYPEDIKKVFVMRVIALEGESVEIKGGGIYINGNEMSDSQLPDIQYVNRGEFGREGLAVTVPDGQLFVLGDNSENSLDSREWGFLPKSFVLGKVYKIYWPPDRQRAIK